MTLIIAYPHSDAACLLNNGTVGAVYALRPPKDRARKEYRRIIGSTVPVSCSCSIFSDTFPTRVQRKRNYPRGRSFPSYLGKQHCHKITSQECHMFD